MNRFIKSLINSTINCFSHHKLYKIVNSLIDDIDTKYFSHHEIPKIVNSLGVALVRLQTGELVPAV